MKNSVLYIIASLALLAACKPTNTFLANEKVQYIRMQTADSLRDDPAVEAMIKPYRDKIAAQMNEIIGTSAQELTAGQPESLLGNWAAETLLREGTRYYGKKIDFATSNKGGLRVRSIAKGNITRSSMFELMPFENALVVLQGDSAVVQLFFNLQASKLGWPIAGATYEIHNQKADNVKIGGEKLRSGRIYTFLTSDYIANGGDACDFLKPLQRSDLGKLMRDAFIEGVQNTTKQGKIVDAKLDARVMIVND
jgi:2',3'-cyclic-nucleotide 2'-phosphodiesterase (5'-nucleotidase family)